MSCTYYCDGCGKKLGSHVEGVLKAEHRTRNGRTLSVFVQPQLVNGEHWCHDCQRAAIASTGDGRKQPMAERVDLPVVEKRGEELPLSRYRNSDWRVSVINDIMNSAADAAPQYGIDKMIALELRERAQLALLDAWVAGVRHQLSLRDDFGADEKAYAGEALHELARVVTGQITDVKAALKGAYNTGLGVGVRRNYNDLEAAREQRNKYKERRDAVYRVFRSVIAALGFEDMPVETLHAVQLDQWLARSEPRLRELVETRDRLRSANRTLSRRRRERDAAVEDLSTVARIIECEDQQHIIERARQLRSAKSTAWDMLSTLRTKIQHGAPRDQLLENIAEVLG